MSCVTKDLAELKFCHLRTHVMKPSDYLKTPVSKVMHFLQDAKLFEGYVIEGACIINERQLQCKDCLLLTLLICYFVCHACYMQGNHQSCLSALNIFTNRMSFLFHVYS
jgi:hypothetical protein